MREILFRAKRIDDSEWVEGYYAMMGKENLIRHYIVQNCALTGLFEDPEDNMYFNDVEIDPETLCQYTGLKDKNEKRIFEGDIFVFDDEVWESAYTSCGIEYDSCDVKNYGAVGYCDYSASFDFTKYKYNENSVEADLHENNTLDFVEFVSELEVCGNIFDNPELLKGE